VLHMATQTLLPTRLELQWYKGTLMARLPEIEKILEMFRESSYKGRTLAFKPNEIGLEDFPRIHRIFPFGCPVEYQGKAYSMKGINAHTHKHETDPLFNSVCFNPMYGAGKPLNDDGSPSDTMIHEYAHVITFYYFTDEDLKNNTYEELQAKAHSNAFYEALVKLGRPDLYWGYLGHYDLSSDYSKSRLRPLVDTLKFNRLTNYSCVSRR